MQFVLKFPILIFPFPVELSPLATSLLDSGCAKHAE